MISSGWKTWVRLVPVVGIFAATAANAQFLNDIPREGLLGAWVDSSAANNSAAFDGSGFGRTMATSGGVTFIAGSYGPFDGSNDELYSAIPSRYSALGTGEVVMLVKASTNTGISVADEVGDLNFFLLRQSTTNQQILFTKTGDAGVSILTAGGLTANVWNVLGFFSSGATNRVWRHNAAVISPTTTQGTNTGQWLSYPLGTDNICICSLHRSTRSWYDGQVGAVLLYDRNLAADERSRIFHALSLKARNLR